MNPFQICVLDNVFTDLEIEKAAIEALGGTLIYLGNKEDEEIYQMLEEVDGIITSLQEVTKEMIYSAKKCKVISRMGVGYNNVDVKAATEKGIFVCNVPDYCIEEVSNHALAFILTLNKKLHISNAMIHKGVWDVNQLMPIQALNQCTLGLLAFGNIAKALAKKAKVLGMNILVTDPFVSEEMAKAEGVTLVDMETLLQKSDFLSLHAPLLQETHHVMNQKTLQKMKPTAYLINTARGALVDEVALYQALQEGWIAGAGLDVLEKEPVQQNHPLLELEQVVFSPHSGYYSTTSNDELRKRTATQTAMGAMGNIPPNVVNKGLL